MMMPALKSDDGEQPGDILISQSRRWYFEPDGEAPFRAVAQISLVTLSRFMFRAFRADSIIHIIWRDDNGSLYPIA